MIYLCACVEVGRLSWYVSALSTHFQTSETVHYAFSCLVRLSHDLQTFLNVLMHVDLFSGTCKLAKDQVIYLCACVEVGRLSWYVSALSTIFKQVKQCIMPFHALCASTTCAHVWKLGDFRGTSAHDLSDFFKCSLDLFSGM